MREESEVLAELREWALADENIEAIVLVGSRGEKWGADALSDYDVDVLAQDIVPFIKSDTWIKTFGTSISRFSERKGNSLTRLVLFSDGVRIDFQIYQINQDEERVRGEEPIATGYRVVVDKKEGRQLKPRTATYFPSTAPTPEEFIALVSDFWWDAPYVAKALCREELYYARDMLDAVIRHSYLTRMIEWHIGLRHSWDVKLNKQGRWFSRHLDAPTLLRIQKIYTGNDVPGTWTALEAMMDLFSELAREVAGKMRFRYELELEENVRAYITKVKNNYAKTRQ